MFEKIDDYFKEKKQIEILLVGFMIIAVIGFLIYTFLLDSSEKFYKQNKNRLNDITQKLNEQTRYLASMKQNKDQFFYVKRLQNEIEQNKNTLQEMQKLNRYVDNKLKKLSYLLFNDKSWSEFLDRISGLAKKYNIKIIEIANRFNQPSLQKIERILNIQVKTEGNYQGTMKFLNAIEKSRLIVDVSHIVIEGKKNIATDMNISVWGMKY